ncbi:uncharacterized protein LOC127290814 [Leptopilina boulardi]|uniref:uncharacterized protein LOC127290814 n=1 Tax=Leptopilina boulardi TaxID=63433 RepID=UPI0021F67553|nr:uncharacterized protein LOC127290814 [Leptopilina boulardi]
MFEIIDEPIKLIKCGYCGEIINFTRETLENLPKNHGCFQHFDQDEHGFSIDEKMVVTLVNLKTPESPVPMSDIDLSDAIIYEVQKRPALYDFKNINVKERTKLKKKDLWQQISCCMKGVLTAEQIETKWNSLKKQYLEARKNEKHLPSGSAAKRKLKKVFPFMKQMEFLNDMQIFDSTISSLKPSVNVESEEKLDNTADEPENETDDDVFMKFQETAMDVMTNIHQKPDVIDGFVMIVKNQLKKLTSNQQLNAEADLLNCTNDLVNAFSD